MASKLSRIQRTGFTLSTSKSISSGKPAVNVTINSDVLETTENNTVSSSALNKKTIEDIKNQNVRSMYELEEGVIETVETSVLSPEEISNMSVVDVFNIDGQFNSLSDRKMGATTSEICLTCSKSYKHCLGHFGRIRLNTYIIHPKFTKYIIYILQSICWDCGKPYIDELILKQLGYDKLSGLNRLKAIAKWSKTKACERTYPNFKKCNTSVKLIDSKKSKKDNNIWFKIDGDTTNELFNLPIISTKQYYTIFDILDTFSQDKIKIKQDYVNKINKLGGSKISIGYLTNLVNDYNRLLKILQESDLFNQYFDNLVDYNNKPENKNSKQEFKINDDLINNIKLSSLDGANSIKKILTEFGTYYNNLLSYAGLINKDGYNYNVYEILDVISKDDESLKLLGFGANMKPINYILNSILVLPPCMRPDNKVSGKIVKDFLTNKYANIIKINNELRNDPKQELIKQLTDEYLELLNGNDKNPGLLKLLEKKTGIVRDSITGKIIPNIVRSVLSNDDSLPYGWVSVPEIFRKVLLSPVIVNSVNLESCKKYLDDGMVEEIKPGSGTFKNIKIRVNKEKLPKIRIGDTIYRWLINGDLVIFNRQPTLHKHGFMAFYARLWDKTSIGIKPAVASAFNADFDGDEGSLIVPNTVEALEDVMGLLHIKNCMLSATNNIAYGFILDSIAGFHKLSNPDTVVNESTYYEIVTQISGPQLKSLDKRLEKYNVDKFSGRGLISALLPEDFYYNEAKVLIKEGILLDGLITKTHVGNTAVSIVKYLYLINPKLAMDFITEGEIMINRYLLDNPATMGLQDCIIFDKKPALELKAIDDKIEELDNSLNTITDNDERLKVVNEIKDLVEQKTTTYEKIQSAIKEYERMIDLLEDTKSKAKTKIEKDRIESEISDLLGKIRGISIKLIDEKSKDGNLKLAISASIKGNDVNRASISGVVAQQMIEGKRAKPKTPFYFNEQSIESRGFIKSGFGGTITNEGELVGMNMTEYFVQSEAAREGILGTTSSTGLVGAMFRTLRILLQNLLVTLDGSVRFVGTSNIVVQPTYMFDPSKLYKISSNETSFTNAKNILEKYNIQYS